MRNWGEESFQRSASRLVPTLCVGTDCRDALRPEAAAERLGLRYHAERGNEKPRIVVEFLPPITTMGPFAGLGEKWRA